MSLILAKCIEFEDKRKICIAEEKGKKYVLSNNSDVLIRKPQSAIDRFHLRYQHYLQRTASNRMTIQPRLTISLRCYGRPQRTIRAIKSVLKQNTNNWELIITGDACPHFETNEFKNFIQAAKLYAMQNGNTITCSNNSMHTGSCGYQIINHDIAIAKGRYFMFMSNDDVMLSNHAANYLRHIEGTPYKWVYFDTWLRPANGIRLAELEKDRIGHSELIIETEYLRSMPAHGPNYGHDWELVQNLMIGTKLYKKAVGAPQTYQVMSVPGNQEQGID